MIPRQIYCPPRKMYAFDRGWSITRDVAKTTMGWAGENVKWWFERMQRVNDWTEDTNLLLKPFGYGVIALFAIIIFMQYGLSVLVTFTFVAVHGLILLLIVAISLPPIGILTLNSRLYTRTFGIHYRCSNAYCYEEMPVPTFICPKCKTPHSYLWPGTYGILFHRCSCGKRLPTLDFLGRSTLERVCPVCATPLDKEMGRGTNIDISIVGGPSSGKTTYLVRVIAALKQLYECPPYNHKISFTDPYHQKDFETRLQQLLNGETLAATPDIAPQAGCLKIEIPKTLVPKLLVTYDAAGEAFSTDAQISMQPYYKYIRGMIFVIDPCAIPAYRRTHSEEIEHIHSSLGPSDLDMEQVYNRMIRLVERYRGVQQSRSYTLPVAVIVTKVDALGLEDEIGMPAAQQWIDNHQSSVSPEEALHTIVRMFLCRYGLNNLVNQLEWQFSSIRYFSCSALGHRSAQNDTFTATPIRILEPLVWLLRQNKVFK